MVPFDFSNADPLVCTTVATISQCTADPAKPVPCGSGCIAAGTCCKTNPLQGQPCAAPTSCPTDGGSCGEGGSRQPPPADRAARWLHAWMAAVAGRERCVRGHSCWLS